MDTDEVRSSPQHAPQRTPRALMGIMKMLLAYPHFTDQQTETGESNGLFQDHIAKAKATGLWEAVLLPLGPDTGEARNELPLSHLPLTRQAECLLHSYPRQQEPAPAETTDGTRSCLGRMEVHWRMGQ